VTELEAEDVFKWPSHRMKKSLLQN